jgi:hypothetical protein
MVDGEGAEDGKRDGGRELVYKGLGRCMGFVSVEGGPCYVVLGLFLFGYPITMHCFVQVLQSHRNYLCFTCPEHPPPFFFARLPALCLVFPLQLHVILRFGEFSYITGSCTTSYCTTKLLYNLITSQRTRWTHRNTNL